MRSMMVFLFLIFITLRIFSQDFIKTNSGDTIHCKISNITPLIITFNKDDHTNSLPIDSITGYKMGTAEFVFTKEIITPQKETPKDYLFSICPGIGGIHGMGGIKLLVGSDGSSGVFASIGYGVMGVYWKAGVQVAFNGFYFSGSYGTTAFYEQGTMVFETKKIYGITLEGGLLLNLTQNKRLFVQISGCYTFANSKIPLPTNYTPVKSETFSGFYPNFGIGVRL